MPISEITYDDLNELLQETAVENLRLEYKRAFPDKDEFLKKISSFSNTLGGYLVIGAEANSSDGRLIAFPGIPHESGYKQRIVQLCYDAVSPPIFPLVSDPISLPDATDRVCYVIFIEESELAPHFLNGRKGIWVRTDEFSQRIHSSLATYAEIQSLSSKRALVVTKRTDLIDRARKRIQSLAERRYSAYGKIPNGLGANVEFSIIPKYPARQICIMDKLRT